jgi:hypothetical protein
MPAKISLPLWEGLREGEKTVIRYEVFILPPSPNLSHQGRGAALCFNSTVLGMNLTL